MELLYSNFLGNFWITRWQFLEKNLYSLDKDSIVHASRRRRFKQACLDALRGRWK